jgi:hypothetical protein
LLTQYERRAEAFQEALTQVVLTQSRRHRHRADLWLGERPAAAAARDRAHYAARPPMLEVRSNHAAWGNFSRPLPDTIRRRLPAAVQTALDYGEPVQFRAEVTADQRETFPTRRIGRQEIGVCDNVSANGRRCKEHRRMIHHGATMVLTVSAPDIPMLERYTFHIPEEHIRTEAHAGWPRSPGGLQRVISGLQQHEVVDAWLPRLVGQLPIPSAACTATN